MENTNRENRKVFKDLAIEDPNERIEKFRRFKIGLPNHQGGMDSGESGR